MWVEHLDVFNQMVIDLAHRDVKIDNEDKKINSFVLSTTIL